MVGALQEFFVLSQQIQPVLPGAILHVKKKKGLFAGLPCLAVLKVAWPIEGRWWHEDGYKRDKFVRDAECLLTNCLASDGPPVLSLRVIIINAVSMQARIPGHLPNLEQLTIMAEGNCRIVL